MKLTSAAANKMLRQLAEDKAFWEEREAQGSVYTAAVNEEPVIPEYDFRAVSDAIAAIDEKVLKLKHAINVSNTSGTVTVGEASLTVDTVLVKMSQLSRRKDTLDVMRKRMPKRRVSGGWGGSGSPEYEYINYDAALVKEEFEQVSAEIMALQMALDAYNQTVTFEVDL